MRNTILSRLKFLPVLLLFSFIGSQSFAQDGAALFNGNCVACHSIGKGKIVGPDLKDIAKRRPLDWVTKWVQNSAAVIASGDAYAVQIFKDNNNVPMPPQNLKPEEVKAVYEYITAEGAKAPKVAKAPVAGNNDEMPKENNTALYLLCAAVLLVVLIYFLGTALGHLNKLSRQKQGLPEPPERSVLGNLWFWMQTHKKIVAVILIFFFLFGTVKGWYVLWGLGVSQGYQPDQPIAFSHKIHAGDNAINCVYCHSGVEKSKTAGIPTANVCMNCHKAIKEGATTGTVEIAKIYKALDYDPNTQTYGSNPKPLVWNRVHNLPDLAYFNHSQHVVVGKVQCQTCHGPVQEMTVAKQFSRLTMGWCIDCHRRTKVQIEGNHYYDNIKSFYHSDTLKVADIGGTECARCHY